MTFCIVSYTYCRSISFFCFFLAWLLFLPTIPMVLNNWRTINVMQWKFPRNRINYYGRFHFLFKNQYEWIYLFQMYWQMLPRYVSPNTFFNFYVHFSTHCLVHFAVTLRVFDIYFGQYYSEKWWDVICWNESVFVGNLIKIIADQNKQYDESEKSFHSWYHTQLTNNMKTSTFTKCYLVK